QVEGTASREAFAEPADYRYRRVRIGIDIAPDLGQLAMGLRIGHAELALLPHDDFEDAGLRAMELEHLVVCKGHGVSPGGNAVTPLCGGGIQPIVDDF